MDAKTILLVEDDFFISDMYQKKLREAGYVVEMARDGEAALKFLEEQGQPMLILLDIMLPGLNGIEILRKMREDERWKSVPVMLLTNLSEREYMEQAKALGAIDYIVKSQLTPTDVIGKVRVHLEGGSA